MPSLKLVYFNLRGRGEVARLVLYVGGVDFEDRRVDFSDWAALKPSTPFGHLPVLEVDGSHHISESGAVVRYAATLAGLSGGSPLEQAKADMVADSLADLATETGKFRWEAKDEETKAEAKKKFFEETFPQYCGKLENVLKGNNGGKGFMVGDKLTFADITSYFVLNEMAMIEPDCLSKYPLLKGHTARIAATPKVKEWVGKRPESGM